MVNSKPETLNSKQTQNPNIPNPKLFIFLIFGLEFWICLGFRV